MGLNAVQLLVRKLVKDKNSGDNQEVTLGYKTDLKVLQHSVLLEERSLYNQTWTTIVNEQNIQGASVETADLSIISPPYGSTQTNRDFITIRYSVNANSLAMGSVSLKMTSLEVPGEPIVVTPLGTFNSGSTGGSVVVRLPYGLVAFELVSSNGPYSAKHYVTGEGNASQVRVIFSWGTSYTNVNCGVKVNLVGGGSVTYYSYVNRGSIGGGYGFFDVTNNGVGSNRYEAFISSNSLGHSASNIESIVPIVANGGGASSAPVKIDVYFNEEFSTSYTYNTPSVVAGPNDGEETVNTPISYTYAVLPVASLSIPQVPAGYRILKSGKVKDALVYRLTVSGYTTYGPFSETKTVSLPDRTPPKITDIEVNSCLELTPFDENIYVGKNNSARWSLNGEVTKYTDNDGNLVVL